MNRQDFKNGDKVIMNSYSMIGKRRKTGEKTGTILKMYDSYALVRIDFGYNECYRYREMRKIDNKKGEHNG